jgi:hypothetical protein
LADAEIYFIANQQPRPVDIVGWFRVTGKEAELWHPETGGVERAAYWIGAATTTVPLHLDPRGSIFVIFRKDAVERSRIIPQPRRHLIKTLDGGWRVYFPPGWGAPAQARFDKLVSWTQIADSGIRYFSGTAAYKKDFNLPASAIVQGDSIVLDLGRVKEIAEVFLNNEPLGIFWKPPFQVDVTSSVKAGENRLEVRITNLWPNRLIGDEQSGAKHFTFSLIRPFKKDSPLLESGLLGPVSVYGSR